MSAIRVFKHYIHAPYILLCIFEFFLLFGCIHVIYEFDVLFNYIYPEQEGFSTNIKATVFATVMILCMFAMTVYQSRMKEGLTGMMLRSLVAMFLLGGLALSMLFYVLPGLNLGKGVLALAATAGYVCISLLRLGYFFTIDEQLLKKRILVIGTGKQANSILSRIDPGAKRYFNIVGYIQVDESVEVDSDKILTPSGSIYELVQQHKVNEIVVALDERRRRSGDHVSKGMPIEELLDCKLHGVQVIDLLAFFEREIGKVELDLLTPSWMVFSDGFKRGGFNDFIKRAFDITASLLLLAVAWPFMLFAVIAIKLEEGIKAPIIYRQIRVGLNGREFGVLKFRSMSVNAEKDGKAVWAQKNDSRVTKVGGFLRNTRIDELPQILNVLKGEMAFVGPRPERPQFVQELSEKIPYFDKRHTVKPGITGWAQLKYPYGASEYDSEQKLTYDLYYAKNHSILLDATIMVQTVEVILVGNGVR